MNEQNITGTIPAVGPFKTFTAEQERVERCRKQPRRAECRHRPVETRHEKVRITRLAATSRTLFPTWMHHGLA